MGKGIIFFAIGGAVGLAISLGFLSFPTADDNETESIAQPTPTWEEYGCEGLRADRDRFGTNCIEDIGMDEYDAKRQEWLDLIEERDLTADEGVAGFFAWVANASEDCRLWVEFRDHTAFFCP